MVAVGFTFVPPPPEKKPKANEKTTGQDKDAKDKDVKDKDAKDKDPKAKDAKDKDAKDKAKDQVARFDTRAKKRRKQSSLLWFITSSP